ncbi:hypothetical protein Tco_0167137 [Tanacetum coccineum]
MHHSKRQSHRFLLVMLRLELHKASILAVGKLTLGFLPRSRVISDTHSERFRISFLTNKHELPKAKFLVDINPQFPAHSLYWSDSIIISKELIVRSARATGPALKLNQFEMFLLDEHRKAK